MTALPPTGLVSPDKFFTGLGLVILGIIMMAWSGYNLFIKRKSQSKTIVEELREQKGEGIK